MNNINEISSTFATTPTVVNSFNSDNSCLRLFANLAFQGSRSDAGKRANFLCRKYHISKHDLGHMCSYGIINAYFECSPETSIIAGNIGDLMYIRDTLYLYDFSRAEIRDMLHELCVE